MKNGDYNKPLSSRAKTLQRQDLGALDKDDLKLSKSAHAKINEAFQAAMTAAIASGAERCATAPSTCYGTKRPIQGYQRPQILNNSNKRDPKQLRPVLTGHLFREPR
jgi:hypothetical protein